MDTIRRQDLLIQIGEVMVYGSRCRGTEKTTSDIDIVVEYKGDIREDDLFNLFHEDEFLLENHKVDINPIQVDKSGNIAEFLQQATIYMESEMVFSIGNRYIYIQNATEGYDYTIYGLDMKEIDGGVYDDSDISIYEVLCFSKDDIIVVDPMGEYKDIAAAWGGQYINLTQSAENVFYVNPFHVPDVVPDIDRFVAEKAEFAYAICEQALKPVPLTSRHIAVIDKAVSHMYEEYFKKRKDKRRTRNRPESPTIPVMRDYILEHYDGNEAAQEIVDQLEVFADGTLDIFAREQSISDENRFTVYGFSELGKRMRAMAMLVMIESITAKIKYNQSDGVATWVYVDEMHELWGEEYSLHALEKMWREVRKRGGICTGMSQNLIDAQRNRSTKTMVSNSEFMLLLDQGTMDKEAVEDLFDISSEQLACVNGAEPGMGLIRFGDKIVPFDNTMEKDSSLYQLFNTNFHEMVNEKNIRQTGKK